jgi:hypothetical protein
MLTSYPVKVEAVVSQNDGSLSVFFDILELDEDEDFSRMSTDPVLAYDDYRRKEKRLECRSLSATFRSIATGSPSSQFRQRRHFTRRN